MPKFYDWQKTFSYDAPFTVVISARGFGKTYGLRRQFVRDYIKDGSRFGVIVRTKESIKGSDGIQYGFFDKLVFNNEFPDYMFKIVGKRAYIARKPEHEDDKPQWDVIGYFLALSDMQKSKESTYINVKRIVFDEFTIDRRTRRNYLPGEFDLLVNAISSLLREIPGDKMRGRVYLLGNACDLTNPYFSRWNVKREPGAGYTWLQKGMVLMHYVQDDEFANMQKDTLVGKLVKGSVEERIIIGNEFARAQTAFIADKPRRARFQFGIVFEGKKFGIWADFSEGYFYVNRKIPAGAEGKTYALTNSDNDVNYLIARRASPVLTQFIELYYSNIVRYDCAETYSNFMRALSLFGVR